MLVTILARQLDYDRWATTTFLQVAADAQQTLNDNRLDVISSHLVNAMVHWLARLQSAKAQGGVWDDRPVAENLPLFHQTHEALMRLLQHWDEEQLIRNTPYTNTKGDAFYNQRYDILQHLTLHSAHHRGQLATRLRELGVAPPQVDYIFWVRGVKPDALVLPVPALEA